jgi:hypothetical protein
MAPAPRQTRTRWAEESVSNLLALPLVAEFVFLSPQTIDGTQREVADFLVSYGEPGVLISQKCQENPDARSAQKAEAWVRKNAIAAVRQLRGALRTGRGTPIWCDHKRRGRVEFHEGLPPIAHGIVLVESFQPVVLEGSAEELPLQYDQTPISYFSVNDFLNVAMQLRTLPEIIDYLDKRRGLPFADLRIIGEEKSLFSLFLLNDGAFGTCLGIDDAKIAVAAHADSLRAALRRKIASDRYSGLLEHVADQLAIRRPGYAHGLTPELIAAFDAPDERKNYLEMQRVLASLRLRERAQLGMAFDSSAQGLGDAPQGFSVRAGYLDSKPDWVFVFASSKNLERSNVLSWISPTMRAAMAYYQKRRCLLVLDRDGSEYQVGLSKEGFEPTVSDHAVGEKLFGKLRIEHHPLHFAPRA